MRTGGSRPPGPLAARLTQVTTSDGIESSPAFSPDGSRLAFASEGAGLRSIVVRRLDDGEERSVTGEGFDHMQPAWSPDGGTLLFVRARVPGKRMEPADVFAADFDGDLWALDLASGREEKLAEHAFNPSVSPDGARIAVDAEWAGPRRLWLLDREGRNPQQVSADPSEAADHLRPRWSPDGRRLAFQQVERTRSDIRVVDLQTKAVTALTSDFTLDIHPVWSPDGHHVYFSSPRGGGLNLWRVPVGADGRPSGVLEQVTTGGAWSPDGRTLAFNSDRAGDMNIWLRSLADGSERPLTAGPGGDYQPSWSPDGRTIAFFSSRAGSVDVWSVDVASGELTALTKGSATEANPCFSPDGARIAYQSDEGGRLEVWVTARDGSGVRPLTRSGVSGHFLRWTPDGRSVVFTAAGSAGHVMAVPADGGDPRPLVDVAGGAHLSFSPDHSRIVDVLGHKALWTTAVRGGERRKLFEFEDPRDRIDYPAVSPDGRAVIFDLFRPSGGDVWLLDVP